MHEKRAPSASGEGMDHTQPLIIFFLMFERS